MSARRTPPCHRIEGARRLVVSGALWRPSSTDGPSAVHDQGEVPPGRGTRNAGGEGSQRPVPRVAGFVVAPLRAVTSQEMLFGRRRRRTREHGFSPGAGWPKRFAARCSSRSLINQPGQAVFLVDRKWPSYRATNGSPALMSASRCSAEVAVGVIEKRQQAWKRSVAIMTSGRTTPPSQHCIFGGRTWLNRLGSGRTRTFPSHLLGRARFQPGRHRRSVPVCTVFTTRRPRGDR